MSASATMSASAAFGRSSQKQDSHAASEVDPRFIPFMKEIIQRGLPNGLKVTFNGINNKSFKIYYSCVGARIWKINAIYELTQQKIMVEFVLNHRYKSCTQNLIASKFISKMVENNVGMNHHFVVSNSIIFTFEMMKVNCDNIALKVLSIFQYLGRINAVPFDRYHEVPENLEDYVVYQNAPEPSDAIPIVHEAPASVAIPSNGDFPSLSSEAKTKGQIPSMTGYNKAAATVPIVATVAPVAPIISTNLVSDDEIKKDEATLARISSILENDKPTFDAQIEALTTEFNKKLAALKTQKEEHRKEIAMLTQQKTYLQRNLPLKRQLLEETKNLVNTCKKIEQEPVSVAVEQPTPKVEETLTETAAPFSTNWWDS